MWISGNTTRLMIDFTFPLSCSSVNEWPMQFRKNGNILRHCTKHAIRWPILQHNFIAMDLHDLWANRLVFMQWALSGFTTLQLQLLTYICTPLHGLTLTMPGWSFQDPCHQLVTQADNWQKVKPVPHAHTWCCRKFTGYSENVLIKDLLAERQRETLKMPEWIGNLDPRSPSPSWARHRGVWADP